MVAGRPLSKGRPEVPRFRVDAVRACPRRGSCRNSAIYDEWARCKMVGAFAVTFLHGVK